MDYWTKKDRGMTHSKKDIFSHGMKSRKKYKFAVSSLVVLESCFAGIEMHLVLERMYLLYLYLYLCASW